MPHTRGVLVRLLVGCLVIVGAAYQTWRFDQQAALLQQDEDRLVRQFNALDLAVADLKAAQAGYVAAGQGAALWMSRVDDLTSQVGAVLDTLDPAAPETAGGSVAAAKAHLDALRRSDGRARNYVRNEQLLLASDVIFVESLDILGRLGTEISTARETRLVAARQQAAQLRQYEQILAGVAVLLVLGLSLVGRTRQDSPTSITSAPAGESAGAVPVDRPVEPLVAQAPALDVTGAADVCVDLARLLDGRDLPALLARAAGSIGAKGVVLWVIDEDKTALHPSLAHGYSPRTLQKLGTLPLDGDNVTAVAGRTLQAQVVRTDAGGSGALAVPLVNPSGCVGVLAAEVTGPAADGSTLPLARLVAAQLAAVVSPIAAPAAGAADPAVSAEAGG